MKLLKHRVYDITLLAKNHWSYENCYIKFFLYKDSQDDWLYRVMEWCYDDSWKAYTLERNNINVLDRLDLIEELENDDLSNWDYNTYNDLDEVINDIVQNWEVFNI